jgi:hypothetical protein
MSDNKKAKIDITMESLRNIDVQGIEQKLQIAGAKFDPKYKVLPSRGAVMGGQYGVEETLDVIGVVLVLAKAFIEGGISNYLAVLVRLPEAIIGFGQVLQEIQELDEEDMQTIINYVIENYPALPSEKAQLIIQHSVKAVFHIYSVIVIVTTATENPEAHGMTEDQLKEAGVSKMLELPENFDEDPGEDSVQTDENTGAAE